MISPMAYNADYMRVSPEERALIEFLRSQQYRNETAAKQKAWEAQNRDHEGRVAAPGDEGERSRA